MTLESIEVFPAGHLVATARNRTVFIPNALPPARLNLGSFAAPLERASFALGGVATIGRMPENRDAIGRLFARVEALASCKIEGAVTSVPDLLELEINPSSARVRPDTWTVQNYCRALAYGLGQAREQPLCKRLFCQLHRAVSEGIDPELEQGMVGDGNDPKGNGISSHLRGTHNIRRAQAPSAESIDALGELEKFVAQNDDGLPTLIKVALVHYQFLAIRAFAGGNGKVGRLIVPLMLFEAGVIPGLVPYFSVYFDRHFREYTRLISDVSRSGAWEAWIRFFLTGVQVTSLSAIERAFAIRSLHDRFLNKVHQERASTTMSLLVESLFTLPVATIPYVSQSFGVSFNAAKATIWRLVELKILSPDIRNTRPQHFYPLDILRLMQPASV